MEKFQIYEEIEFRDKNVSVTEDAKVMKEAGEYIIKKSK